MSKAHPNMSQKYLYKANVRKQRENDREILK
jgi:hypothetical protein